MTAVVYREPGLLVKCVSTLDVLSEGRAWLGIGAAWNGDEAAALGLNFPPTAERFERLEETLQIFRQMTNGQDAPYEGKHYTLARTLNVPQPLRRVPVLIGGGGERKTLRLVAQYADRDLPSGYEGFDHHLVIVLECFLYGRVELIPSLYDRLEIFFPHDGVLYGVFYYGADDAGGDIGCLQSAISKIGGHG